MPLTGEMTFLRIVISLVAGMIFSANPASTSDHALD
jgi:hypothetical protein